MDMYYFLEVKIPLHIEDEVDQVAHQKFSSTGIEEFSIEEAKVDEILGDRSYSGGDVPEGVINEVEQTLKEEGIDKKIYFSTSAETQKFKAYLQENYDLQSKIYEFETKDWNAEWKKSYSPIVVNEDLEIIPEWEKENYKSNTKNQIYIYPGMGFGTGSHETTFLCLKLFMEKFSASKALDSCLDFGCGSGILGIAYKLIDPKGLVDLYDIDAEALKNSEQNIVLNDMKIKNFNLLLPIDRQSIERKYSVVFANILQNVLLLESKYLANSIKANGCLILSGLLIGQESEVIKSMIEKNPRIYHLETITKGDWVAVLMSCS